MKLPDNLRIPIAALSLSAAAFVGILTREGYTDKAVIPVPGDVLTIGFGTTNGVKIGDKITPVKAVQRALSDSSKFEGAIKQCVNVPLHQYEYDAYTNLSYNIGPAAFCNSTAVRRLNASNYMGACEGILMFKMFRGFDCSTPSNKICYGLWKDRLRVHTQCLGGI
jgi:lysozyme